MSLKTNPITEGLEVDNVKREESEEIFSIGPKSSTELNNIQRSSEVDKIPISDINEPVNIDLTLPHEKVMSDENQIKQVIDVDRSARTYVNWTPNIYNVNGTSGDIRNVPSTSRSNDVMYIGLRNAELQNYYYNHVFSAPQNFRIMDNARPMDLTNYSSDSEYSRYAERSYFPYFEYNQGGDYRYQRGMNQSSTHHVVTNVRTFPEVYYQPEEVIYIIAPTTFLYDKPHTYNRYYHNVIPTINEQAQPQNNHTSTGNDSLNEAYLQLGVVQSMEESVKKLKSIMKKANESSNSISSNSRFEETSNEKTVYDELDKYMENLKSSSLQMLETLIDKNKLKASKANASQAMNEHAYAKMEHRAEHEGQPNNQMDVNCKERPEESNAHNRTSATISSSEEYQVTVQDMFHEKTSEETCCVKPKDTQSSNKDTFTTLHTLEEYRTYLKASFQQSHLNVKHKKNTRKMFKVKPKYSQSRNNYLTSIRKLLREERARLKMNVKATRMNDQDKKNPSATSATNNSDDLDGPSNTNEKNNETHVCKCTLHSLDDNKALPRTDFQPSGMTVTYKKNGKEVFTLKPEDYASINNDDYSAVPSLDEYKAFLQSDYKPSRIIVKYNKNGQESSESKPQENPSSNNHTSSKLPIIDEHKACLQENNTVNPKASQSKKSHTSSKKTVGLDELEARLFANENDKEKSSEMAKLKSKDGPSKKRHISSKKSDGLDELEARLKQNLFANESDKEKSAEMSKLKSKDSSSRKRRTSSTKTENIDEFYIVLDQPYPYSRVNENEKKKKSEISIDNPSKKRRTVLHKTLPHLGEDENDKKKTSEMYKVMSKDSKSKKSHTSTKTESVDEFDTLLHKTLSHLRLDENDNKKTSEMSKVMSKDNKSKKSHSSSKTESMDEFHALFHKTLPHLREDENDKKKTSEMSKVMSKDSKSKKSHTSTKLESMDEFDTLFHKTLPQLRLDEKDEKKTSGMSKLKPKDSQSRKKHSSNKNDKLGEFEGLSPSTSDEKENKKKQEMKNKYGHSKKRHSSKKYDNLDEDEALLKQGLSPSHEEVTDKKNAVETSKDDQISSVDE